MPGRTARITCQIRQIGWNFSCLKSNCLRVSNRPQCQLGTMDSHRRLKALRLLLATSGLFNEKCFHGVYKSIKVQKKFSNCSKLWINFLSKLLRASQTCRPQFCFIQIDFVVCESTDFYIIVHFFAILSLHNSRINLPSRPILVGIFSTLSTLSTLSTIPPTLPTS